MATGIIIHITVGREKRTEFFPDERIRIGSDETCDLQVMAPGMASRGLWFEIENSDLSSSTSVGDLSWLSVNPATHVEARTDQYVAAFRYVSDQTNFSTAYMVRATSPGKFVMPGATIEDMYRPELRANTDAGSVEVKTPGP